MVETKEEFPPYPKFDHRQLSRKIHYIEFSMYNTSKAVHRIFRRNVHAKAEQYVEK